VSCFGLGRLEQETKSKSKRISESIHSYGERIERASMGRGIQMIDYFLFLGAMILTIITSLAVVWGGIGIWMTYDLLVEKIRNR
jgi:hypothetical protein